MAAPGFTWTSDVPNTGALKNSFLSKQLYEAAIADTHFVELCKPISGYGKNKGESVTCPRVSNISEPTDASLSEFDRIPEDQHSISAKVITVQEFGRSVPYTSLAQDLNVFDLENSIQMKLKQQQELAFDKRACRAFKQSKLTYVPTGAASSTTSTNGTAAAAGASNLNVYHLESMRDLLYGTYQTPMINNDHYVGVFHWFAIRGLTRDPDWQQWYVYTDPQAKYNHEFGQFEQCRLIETNHVTTTLSSTGLPALCGTGSCMGEGFLFGDEAVAYALAQAPELRAGIPSDGGRSKVVYWYGIYEFSIIWDTANAGEARIMWFTSNV